MAMPMLPADLLYEILVRLPARAVESLVASSRTFAAVVRKASFYKDFQFHRSIQSSRQPRALFATRVDSREWIFKSISIEEQELPLLLTTTTLPLHDNRKNQYMNYSCGLLCSGFGANPIIFNTSNGRYRRLPEVFSGKEEFRSFIGFERGSGFKVLGVKKCECKVLNLETMTWKLVRNLQNRPATQSVCINGIISYAAYDTATNMVVVNFDLKTDLFQVVKIPQKSKFGQFFCEKTMEVNGKLGISFASGGDRHVLWVLENPINAVWSQRFIESPSSIHIQRFSPLTFEGITIYGETVFSQDVGSTKVLYYSNGENDVIKKHVYQGLGLQTLIFLEHVDSTMFL